MIETVDTIGAVNLVAFVGGWIINKFTGALVVVASIADSPIFKNWTDIMFCISATGSALYIILKIITWFRNNKKNKK